MAAEPYSAPVGWWQCSQHDVHRVDQQCIKNGVSWMHAKTIPIFIPGPPGVLKSLGSRPANAAAEEASPSHTPAQAKQ